MEIVVFDKLGLQRAIVKPDDSSEVTQSKQTADYVKLNFVLNEFVDIQIGDYIILPKNGKKYTILKRPSVVESPKRHSYNCLFYGSIHDLQKTKVRLTTQKADGTHYTDYNFPLTGNAETFLQFIVENLNRNGYDIKAGSYKETETTDINFNDWNVFDAITEISSTLNFDWYLEDDTLHFDKKTVQKAITIKAGRDNGATSITRYEVENQGNLTTVLMGVGSAENMPPRTGEGDTYDSSILTDRKSVV